MILAVSAGSGVVTPVTVPEANVLVGASCEGEIMITTDPSLTYAQLLLGSAGDVQGELLALSYPPIFPVGFSVELVAGSKLYIQCPTAGTAAVPILLFFSLLK